MTDPQILALWLVATSQRSAPQGAGANPIPLNDDAALNAEAGIDTTRADVGTVRAFLANDPRLDDTRRFFNDAIGTVNYTPPECPSDAHLRALSAQPQA